MHLQRLVTWCGCLAALVARPVSAQPPAKPMLPAVAVEAAESPGAPLSAGSVFDPEGSFGSSCGDLVGSGCLGFSSPAWQSGGLLAGVELTFLKPFPQAGVGNDEPQYSLAPGTRLWAGYERTDCWGIEARYWIWSHDAGAVSAAAGSTRDSQISAQSLDLVFHHEFPFRRWGLRAGGGIRYGSLETTLTDTAHVPQPLDTAGFAGIGPTLFVDGRKPLTPELAAIAKGRYSLLLGTLQDDWDFGGAGQGDRQDAFLQVSDLQLGIEWFHSCRRGGRWFLRAAFEAQAWHTSELDALHGDLAFVGPTLAIGLDR
jgi:hypothetical protein